jgi:phage-related tail protein
MRRLGLVILSGFILTGTLVYGRTQAGTITPNPEIASINERMAGQGKQIAALGKAVDDLRTQAIKVTLTNCKPAAAVASGEQTGAVGVACSANQVMNGIQISSSPYKQTFQPICCDVSAQR